MSSLPVPLSPLISTAKFWAATRPMALYTLSMAGQVPTMVPSRRGPGPPPRSRPVSRICWDTSRASPTTCRNFPGSNGLKR